MIEVPKPLLDGIVQVFDPVQVFLFGSHARGEAHADSDIDLYVVVDDDTPDERLRAVGRASEAYDGDVDIIVARQSTHDRKKTWLSSIARQVVKEGRLVYVRAAA